MWLKKFHSKFISFIINQLTKFNHIHNRMIIRIQVFANKFKFICLPSSSSSSDSSSDSSFFDFLPRPFGVPAPPPPPPTLPADLRLAPAFATAPFFCRKKKWQKFNKISKQIPFMTHSKLCQLSKLISQKYGQKLK